MAGNCMWRTGTWLAILLPVSLFGSGTGFMPTGRATSGARIAPFGGIARSRTTLGTSLGNIDKAQFARTMNIVEGGEARGELGGWGGDNRGEGHKRPWNRMSDGPRRLKVTATGMVMGIGGGGGDGGGGGVEMGPSRPKQNEKMMSASSGSSSISRISSRSSFGGRVRGDEAVSRDDGQCEATRASFELRASAVPAGDDSASATSSWPRRVSSTDEGRRLRSTEWIVGDSGPATTPCQPWELRSLSLDEQVSHLNRGLLQLSATFGWCVTDAEAVELDGFNGQVLQDASYLTPTEQQWVGVAVQVAYHAHQGQRRKSGEPFIAHPVEVMQILAGLRMDAETLVAGLLHDTVEDTRLSFHDIEAHFGSTVRRIVEGETKLSKIPGRVSAFTASMFEMEGAATAGKDAAKQADNLRHMLIAMSKDWRVLVVKLADRLHNMRTLGAMAQHKQVRIAHETMGVFVPLARRMGLWQIKSELEDRCFRTLHPEDYDHVTELLRLRALTTGHTEAVLEHERRRLQDVLSRTHDMDGRVASFRVIVGAKPPYTVWRSMQRNGGLLGGVLDCIHFTIVFSLHPQPGPDGVVRSSFENSERERAACYRLLESTHGLLVPISPPRVEDFIAVPKPNNYRALHSAVMLLGNPLEVQILTDDMYRVAQFGLAASQVARSSGNPKNLPWLAELQTSAEACALGCGDTYSASVRDSLTRAQERRFVFDPQGKILDLAGNATMCDAARELHDSKTCRVAATYVNGRLVPLNRPLKNGDVVAILTAPFLPPKRPYAAAEEVNATPSSREVPLHVHTGVWPWSMVSLPMAAEIYEGTPERLAEIDEIPEMTAGERRIAREVELKHARLRLATFMFSKCASSGSDLPRDTMSSSDERPRGMMSSSSDEPGLGKPARGAYGSHKLDIYDDLLRISVSGFRMFAVLAWTTVEVERVSGLAALRPDAMAALHESPFKYLAALSPQQALRVVMVVGALEGCYLLFNAIQDRFEDANSRRERDGITLTPQEKAMLKRRTFHSRERELHTGRVAMIAISCLSMQSVLAGEGCLAHFFGLL